MKAIIVKTNNLLADSSAKVPELKKLVGELKSEMEFGLALKVLKRLEEYFPKALIQKESAAGDDPDKKKEALWIQQQKALCIYKNEEVHAGVRLPRAWNILRHLGLENPDCDHETLGLAGAVCKRLWEYRGRMEDIYASLAFYRRAWLADPAKDMGYAGVNAAFILDLLADQANKAAARAGMTIAGTDSAAQARQKDLMNKLQDDVARYRQEAEALRREMLIQISEALTGRSDRDTNYWYAVTLAEIHLGLLDYEQAGRFLAKAGTLGAAPWELQSTIKQLIRIARMQGAEIPDAQRPWHPAWQALKELLGDDTEGAVRSHTGKVGLALSGGGFRASLFHLGVLARLAEMDVLRHVQVLSTVSGGSIIGAHYYLELQHLLQTTADQDLTREDYVHLVRRLQHNFIEAVQKNIRMRAVGGFWSNLKVLFLPGYTRSVRLAELYQKYIYNSVPKGEPSRRADAMPDLMIAPRGEGPREEFSPGKVNWRRRAKVPTLLINTTSLNSGHNYHFTAKFMGEPPGLTGFEVDMNARYRRIYYNDLENASFRNFSVGKAVAASACVPGLFEPIELNHLYPGHELKLVDGGVHDNQGVAGLLDEDCQIILCSDACGQMGDQVNPKTGRLGVLLRSNSILQDRIREAQYQELKSRVDAGSLDGLFFIHLKKDLRRDPIDWVDCQDKTIPPDRGTQTPYHIDREIQGYLADLRTDLDSFTEVEAYALMLSGYEMTRYQFEQLALDEQEKTGLQNAGNEWKGFPVDAPTVDWPFLPLRDVIGKPHDTTDQRRRDLGKQLKAGSSIAFKIWKLSKTLQMAGIVLGLALVAAAGWWLCQNWFRVFFQGGVTPGEMLLAVGLPLAVLAVPALAWITPMRAVKNILFNIGLVALGWLVTCIHLAVFDRLFLRRGRLRRLLRLSAD